MTGIGGTQVQFILAERYELIREVGRGGMATVYVADDQKHGRHVAVKVLEPELRMQSDRSRFVWGWIMGCSDAETLYEAAAAHAIRGETTECIAALQRAADFGWSDLNQLNHDPAFAVLRERTEIRELGTAAASRVTLPPPVGSGGLPGTG
jgi:serine/threonine protein kinase